MKMPNFLIIGTQKAGTSALTHYLKQHPQIYMSPVKEPGFFDLEGEKQNFCGPGDQEAYSLTVTDIESYCKLFQGVTNETAIGEATTWYLQSIKAPERIHYYIPDAKLIAILRNPVDRAYSAYMHAIRDGREPLADFALALEDEDKRIRNNWGMLWRYKQMGFYSIQIKRYFEKFDRNQIRIYIYDDLNDNPTELLKDVFHFLGVEDTFMPKVFTRINISGIRQSKTIETLLDDKNLIKKILKPVFPIKLRKNLANYIRTKNYMKYDFPIEIKIQLKSIFRNDICKLQELLQRDLSKWL